MNVGGISPNYPVAYSAEKAQKTETHKSFSKSMEEIIQESGVGAIGSVNGSGDMVMDSVCDNVNDLLTVVYKTQDFDPENPVYKAKTWDTEGNVTERMIDVSKINAKNCKSFEMLAYTTYLWDSGKADHGEIMRKFAMLWAVKNAGPNGLRPCDYSEKVNWVKEVQDTMQLQYDVGNLAGYMEWKKFMEPQVIETILLNTAIVNCMDGVTAFIPESGYIG